MKHFWKYIKHEVTDFDGVAPLRVNGKLVTDPKLEAEAPNKQFQSVFTQENEFHPNPTSPQLASMDKITFTEAGVLNLLKNLNLAKASGPHNTSLRALKELSDVIANPLT